ncbi:Protein of unknown function (DUF2808) [Xenococcus sp. PCC 7305]|uniref:DUF2808 domain-containing protein n=1 Tax=Xenococcus sp. PCC 7305 TaxID=102125 RepID=UPI0002AD04CC|nr:DUF2808 domain-containing protein [Xenococcus sp. PCC 7305]ELS04887.1 Protein of unknown function (DUF2808) [Xenococcus sp. PCC 7305]
MSHLITKIPWTTGKKIGLVTSTLALSLLIPNLSTTVNAFEVGENETVFLAAPRLTRAATTNLSPNGPSIYHFTIEVPENADEALQAITVSQRDNPVYINFALDKSNAFMGDSFAGGPNLALADIGGDLSVNPNDITVVFDEPVQPGETVTVRLRAKRNPARGGIYLFGVTAFPEGENSSGLYIGSKSLQFYSY